MGRAAGQNIKAVESSTVLLRTLLSQVHCTVLYGTLMTRVLFFLRIQF